MQDLAKMVYVLVETDDTSRISAPIKTTNRIKFLCFTASSNFIVFGATSGGLYVYNRESFTFISLIPNKEGPVTSVRISPDEKWFGFATSRGICCALEHSGSSVNRRILSHEHEGIKVTALHWNDCSTQLYMGDDTGKISVISVASYLTPAVALMQLDSSIVQLDSCSYLLVASSKTRSYLCDTFREQYRQIGTRMRDGDFGACFYHVDSTELSVDLPHDINVDLKDMHGPYSSLEDGETLLADKHLQTVKLFCARPGMRLWEVRVDGAVMSTHQFKQLLSTPPFEVINPPAVGVPPDDANDSYQADQMFQFTKLFKIANKFIITWDSNGIFVLDPMTSQVVLWTNQYQNIADVCVVGENIYLLMGDCRFHVVSLLPIDKFLVRMYLQKKYLYCSRLCASYANTLRGLTGTSSKMHVLVDLPEKMKEENKENSLDACTLSKINDLLAEVSKNAVYKEQAQMLNSGIFIVGNAHLLSQREGLRLPNLNINHSNAILPKKTTGHQTPINQEFQLEQDEQIDSMNVLSRKYNPSLLSSPYLDQTQVNSDEDYDPFPDLPLSSLTSVETVKALKNLTTTVSGTISNGTNLLKEKWQTFEEKLRGQEENCLSVEKSVNRPDAKISYTHEKTCATSTSYESYCKLWVSDFVGKWNQTIQCHKSDQILPSYDSLCEILNDFAILYEKLSNLTRSESEECLRLPSSFLEEQEIINNFGKRLNSSEITSFLFIGHFDPEFIVTLRFFIHGCLKSGAIVKWLSPFLPSLELNKQLFPTYISSMYPKESLILDQALGRTLKIFSHLLDPHLVLQCLDHSGAPCHHFTWNIIMDHFYDCPITVSDENSSTTWPLPRKLNAILVMLQLGQVESCRNIGENIPLKHILRTVFRLNNDALVQRYNLFLSYLDKIPSSKLEEELADEEVFEFTRHAFESLNITNEESQCPCGFPVNVIQDRKAFQNVGQTMLNLLYQNKGISDAFTFCQKTGALWSFLLTLRRNEKVEEVLPLMLQVSCEEELIVRCIEFVPSNWELVFHLKTQLELGYCLQCNARRSPLKSIPWITLASLLVKETSIDFAMTLLSTYSHSIPSGSLDLKFYQSCLLASVAESQGIELKKRSFEVFAGCKTMSVMSNQVAHRLGLPSNSRQHHWGLRLQLSESNCLFCMLSLASLSESSVISFYCSHSFHMECLQQRLLKQCPICAK